MGGPLTDEEIFRIVDYVQSDEFREDFKKVKAGEVVPGFPPKDAYFYISQGYMNGEKKAAIREDIEQIIEIYRVVNETRVVEEEESPGETLATPISREVKAK